MSGTVDLKNMSFNKLQQIHEQNKNKVQIIEIVDEITYEMIKNHSQLINDIEKNNMPKTLLDNEVDRYLKRKQIVIEDANNYEDVLELVKSYLWGYGPLQKYLEDMEISDISINDVDDTWIKKNGKRINTDICFPSVKSIENFAYAICMKNGGNLSDKNPTQVLSDTTILKDFKLRIDICIPPVSVNSPTITIRKIPKKKYNLEQLLNMDMFNLDMYVYFRKGMEAGLNIFWGGKGASGKTTHMNACIEYIPEEKSKLFIQESDEISTEKGNKKIRMIKKKSGESDIEHTLQDLVINGLLEDIDVMCIGESKGAEAMDLIDAGYTGHIIYSTTHSPSADKTINKIILNMKKSGTDYKREDLLEMLSEIDVIIYMNNFKCVEVTEVAGFDYEKNELMLNPVFKFVTKKITNGISEGYFKRVGKSCDKIQRKFDVIDFKLE